MPIPGLRTLARTIDSVRRNLTGSSVILCYHRIAEAAFDPWNLCVRPASFAEHLDVLREAGTVVPLNDLVAALLSRRPLRNAIAITFDDGYLDNLEVAVPMLAHAGLPATFFVTTGFHGRDFWWEELERLIAMPSELPALLRTTSPAGAHAWSTRSAGSGPADRLGLLHEIHPVLMGLRERDRTAALAQIASQVQGAPAPDQTRRAMTVDELRELARQPGMDVGAHSVTHPALGLMDEAIQEREMRDSASALLEALGTRPPGFSYPHGSVSAATPRLARAVGYTYACTTRRSSVTGDCDPCLLPRLFPEDYDGEAFQRALAGVRGRLFADG